MAQRDAIIKFAEELLRSKEIPDEWCENGLQVEGAPKVRRIALGVSSSAAFLEAAATWKAEMCVVHHGLFWKKGPVKILGTLKNRLQILLSHDMSLVNFHIPLDAHPLIGNNALLLKMLGLKKSIPLDCGFLGTFAKPLPFAKFLDLVQQKIGPINFSADFSHKPVQRVGVISGGAASLAAAVKAAGADTFLFGEMHEPDYHELKELGLSFVAAGHFATERYGIQELGKKIAAKFKDVEVRFFDEDCPV